MNNHTLRLATVLTLASILNPVVSHGEPENAHSTSGWKISSHLEKSSFTADEPIYLDVTLTNTSAGTLKYGERSPQLEFTVHVKDRSGNEIPTTRFAKSYGKLTTDVFKQLSRTAKPGEGLVYHFWLNRSFDLTVDGSYTVTVSRQMPISTTDSSLVASPLEFQITEPNWTSDPARTLDIPKKLSM